MVAILFEHADNVHV